MIDPRKPIQQPSPSENTVLRDIIHSHLLACTERGAQATGLTGATFVLGGMGVWAQELSELDGRATAQFLESLAVIFDPKAKHQQKVKAEKRRRAAVKKILAALDLEMATPAGSA